MSAAPARSEQLLFAMLALLVASVWMAALGQRPLFNPDEGRYAEIPREMLAGGDWVVPHLNGLPYIEKPPLQYWATAVAFKLFGRSALSARLYTSLCALGCVLLVGLLGRRGADPAAGLRAGVMLLSMLLFVVLAQLLTLDMSLTFYLTLALSGFILAQRAAESSGERSPQVRHFMLVAWVAAALGVLTKGVVAAAIPACVLVLYSLWTRDFVPWRRLSLPLGLTLFLLITVPWHWLAAHRLPDFLEFFFVHEHLARYLTPVAQRVEPWWYFLAVFVLGMLPWSVSAVRVLVSDWRSRPETAGRFDQRRFLWLWALFVIVFFSLSDSKLIPYILPAFPSVALLIAQSTNGQLRRELKVAALLSVAVGLALLAGALSLPRLLAGSERSAFFLPLAKPLLLMAALIGLSGLYALLRGTEQRRATVLLATGWGLGWLLLLRGAASTAPVYSGIAFVAPLAGESTQVPLYSVGTYDQTLPFYLGRTVQLVHYRGELDYGLQHDPAAEISDMQVFLARWRSDTDAYALMERTLFNDLQQQGVPMRLVVVSAGRVLVARQ